MLQAKNVTTPEGLSPCGIEGALDGVEVHAQLVGAAPEERRTALPWGSSNHPWGSSNHPG